MPNILITIIQTWPKRNKEWKLDFFYKEAQWAVVPLGGSAPPVVLAVQVMLRRGRHGAHVSWSGHAGPMILAEHGYTGRATGWPSIPRIFTGIAGERGVVLQEVRVRASRWDGHKHLNGTLMFIRFLFVHVHTLDCYINSFPSMPLRTGTWLLLMTFGKYQRGILSCLPSWTVIMEVE